MTSSPPALANQKSVVTYPCITPSGFTAIAGCTSNERRSGPKLIETPDKRRDRWDSLTRAS